MEKIIWLNQPNGTKTEFAKLPSGKNFMDWIAENQEKVFAAVGHFYDDEEPKFDTIDRIIAAIREEIIKCMDTCATAIYFGDLKRKLDYFEEQKEKGYTYGYLELRAGNGAAFRSDRKEFKVKHRGCRLIFDI